MKEKEIQGNILDYQITLTDEASNNSALLTKATKNLSELIREIPALVHVQLYGLYGESYLALLHHTALLCSITCTPMSTLVDDIYANSIEIQSELAPSQEALDSLQRGYDALQQKLWAFYETRVKIAKDLVQEQEYKDAIDEIYSNDKLKHKLVGTDSVTVH